MRECLRRLAHAEPEVVAPFVLGTTLASNSSSDIPWCSCGNCQIFDDPCMNICCHFQQCITLKPEVRNLCLRHDVLEVANILNWSYRTNLDPSFRSSTFRNQAYRKFVLWQHGRLGAGSHVMVPSCVCKAIRTWFPEPEGGHYRGNVSAHSDSD